MFNKVHYTFIAQDSGVINVWKYFMTYFLRLLILPLETAPKTSGVNCSISFAELNLRLSIWKTSGFINQSTKTKKYHLSITIKPNYPTRLQTKRFYLILIGHYIFDLQYKTYRILSIVFRCDKY